MNGKGGHINSSQQLNFLKMIPYYKIQGRWEATVKKTHAGVYYQRPLQWKGLFIGILPTTLTLTFEGILQFPSVPYRER